MVEAKSSNSDKVSNVDYRVQIVSYEVVENNSYAVYNIKVVGPRDIVFHIKDRYSSLREFQALIKKSIESSDGTPSFPKKKFFGNMEANFLKTRMNQLGLFLNTFLAHPLVKSCELVPVYFKGKAVTPQDEEATQRLIAFMSGQPIPRQPNVRKIQGQETNNAFNQQSTSPDQQLLTGKDANKDKTNALGSAPTMAQKQSNFDTQQLQQQVDANCREIVDQITGKFIDFGLDDGHSSYGNETSDKLNRLRDHFEVNTLNFETKCLDLPKGHDQAGDYLFPSAESLQSMNTADTEMGKDLDDVFNILNNDAREELADCHVIIEHRWNSKQLNFEK